MVSLTNKYNLTMNIDKRKSIESLLSSIAELDADIDELEASETCDGCSPHNHNLLSIGRIKAIT